MIRWSCCCIRLTLIRIKDLLTEREEVCKRQESCDEKCVLTLANLSSGCVGSH